MSLLELRIQLQWLGVPPAARATQHERADCDREAGKRRNAAGQP